MRALLILLAMSATISVAVADNFCDVLSENSANWTEISAAINAKLGRKNVACGSAMGLSGKVSHHCYWAFDFRSIAAQDAYKLLYQQLTECSNAGADIQDKGVNHPDSYTLENFDFGKHDLALSLKDKATLGQTLIFVHLRGQH